MDMSLSILSGLASALGSSFGELFNTQFPIVSFRKEGAIVDSVKSAIIFYSSGGWKSDKIEIATGEAPLEQWSYLKLPEDRIDLEKLTFMRLRNGVHIIPPLIRGYAEYVRFFPMPYGSGEIKLKNGGSLVSKVINPYSCSIELRELSEDVRNDVQRLEDFLKQVRSKENVPVLLFDTVSGITCREGSSFISPLGDAFSEDYQQLAVAMVSAGFVIIKEVDKEEGIKKILSNPSGYRLITLIPASSDYRVVFYKQSGSSIGSIRATKIFSEIIGRTSLEVERVGSGDEIIAFSKEEFPSMVSYFLPMKEGYPTWIIEPTGNYYLVFGAESQVGDKAAIRLLRVNPLTFLGVWNPVQLEKIEEGYIDLSWLASHLYIWHTNIGREEAPVWVATLIKDKVPMNRIKEEVNKALEKNYNFAVEYRESGE